MSERKTERIKYAMYMKMMNEACVQVISQESYFKILLQAVELLPRRKEEDKRIKSCFMVVVKKSSSFLGIRNH